MAYSSIKKQILENIEKVYFPVLKAEHIMSFPVKTVSAKTGIKEALKIMVRFGFSGLPVEENNRVIGIISKRDIEKIMRKCGISSTKNGNCFIIKKEISTRYF